MDIRKNTQLMFHGRAHSLVTALSPPLRIDHCSKILIAVPTLDSTFKQFESRRGRLERQAELFCRFHRIPQVLRHQPQDEIWSQIASRSASPNGLNERTPRCAIAQNFRCLLTIEPACSG